MVLPNSRPTVESGNKERKKTNPTNIQHPKRPTWINFKSKNTLDLTKLKTIYTNIDSLLNKRQELAQIIDQQSKPLKHSGIFTREEIMTKLNEIYDLLI